MGSTIPPALQRPNINHGSASSQAGRTTNPTGSQQPWRGCKKQGSTGVRGRDDAIIPSFPAPLTLAAGIGCALAQAVQSRTGCDENVRSPEAASPGVQRAMVGEGELPVVARHVEVLPCNI